MQLFMEWPCVLYIVTACLVPSVHPSQSHDTSYYTLHNGFDHILEDGSQLRFSAKPPLFDIQRAGTTKRYRCTAQVVRSNHTDYHTNTPQVEVHWLIPQHLTRINYTGEDWQNLRGQGYFIDEERNHSLVLVHPSSSDGGRYTCRLRVGKRIIDTHMELYIIYYDSLDMRKRVLYGLAAMVLMLVLIGLLRGLHYLIYHRKSSNNKDSVIVSGAEEEELQPM